MGIKKKNPLLQLIIIGCAFCYITGCASRDICPQVKVYIHDELNNDNCNNVYPHVTNLTNNAILLDRINNVAINYCGWSNENLNDFLNQSIIIKLVFDSSNLPVDTIILDTVVVEHEYILVYNVYIGAPPSRDYPVKYEKIAVKGIVGDTIYIEFDKISQYTL